MVSFETFIRTYEKNIGEIKSLVKQLLDDQVTLTVKETLNRPQTLFSAFQGVVPNPNAGRTSDNTSFVNVALRLKEVIERKNDETGDRGAKMSRSYSTPQLESGRTMHIHASHK